MTYVCMCMCVHVVGYNAVISDTSTSVNVYSHLLSLTSVTTKTNLLYNMFTAILPLNY
jgi:hypothetical protein